MGARVRKKLDDQIDELRIGKLMEEFGFNPAASTSTARALILNLVRSAYGPEAAREFMRQMNLEKNRDVEPSVVLDAFKREQAASHRSASNESSGSEIPGVGTNETQLPLFNFDQTPGTFFQKKSRRA